MNTIKYKKQFNASVLMVSIFMMSIFLSSCEFELPDANSKIDETPPSAYFIAVESEDYMTYNFGNLSSSATDYAWDFGDGNTSTSKDGVNTYADPGDEAVEYTVTLVASDKLGVESIFSAVITIEEPEAPASIIPEILNGDFTSGQDDWKISSFETGTTSPFNSSSDGSSTNYDGTDNGSKTAGAKWTKSTSAGEWVSSSTRYAYQAIKVSANTEYVFEYEYAIKDDTATDPIGGRRIVGEILDGHFATGELAVASSAVGPLVRHEGTNAGGKTSFTLVKEIFTSNDSGEIAIWIYGVTPKDAYIDNVKVYPYIP